MKTRTNIRFAAATTAAFLTAAASAMVHCTDFDPPAPGAPFPCCGVAFAYDGITFMTRPFETVAGGPIFGGNATPWNACNGAGGHSLWLSNVNTEVRIPDFFGTPGVRRVKFWYADYGGSVNLRVNGHLASSWENFHNIPAAEFNGVFAQHTVSAVWTGSAWEGVVEIEAAPGHCIRSLSIGGQELCLDDLCAEGECGRVGDATGDGKVDFQDILAALAAWGQCPPPPVDCPEDVNGDGKVDFGDILIMLQNWSP